MSNHTPTPWTLIDNGKYLEIKVPWDGRVVANKFSPSVVDMIAYEGNDGINGRANAEFIVRACNSHAQLVEALKSALAVIDDYLNYEHNGDPWVEDARAMGEMDIDDYSRDGSLEKARAALAAAGAL